MTTPKTPARLDADRTAQPLTRIVHHPPHGGCLSPYMPLVNPEYEDENGKRTALTAETCKQVVAGFEEQWPDLQRS